MKKIVLSLIIGAVLVLCIASAGCIDGKSTINYSNFELESQIVQSLNELGADLGYPSFKISNKYYPLCLETSQYNSERGNTSVEKAIRFSSAFYILWLSVPLLNELLGVLSSISGEI